MEGTGKSRDAARRRRDPRPVSVVLASNPVGLLNLAADESGLRPGARIQRAGPVYASGYSAEHVDSLAAGPQAPLLEKPYSLEQLAARVRAVLDARSEAIR